MRYEPEHKTRTRDRIVRNAARKLRAEGLRGPGVASVMQASGLTVGGFYKHFRSKDELLADAIAEGFSESSEKIYSSLQNVPREDRWLESEAQSSLAANASHAASRCCDPPINDRHDHQEYDKGGYGVLQSFDEECGGSNCAEHNDA